MQQVFCIRYPYIPKGKVNGFTIKSQDHLRHGHLSSSFAVANWSYRCGQGDNSVEMEGIMTIWSSFTFVLGSSAENKSDSVDVPLQLGDVGSWWFPIFFLAREGSYHSVEAIEKWQSPDVLLISKKHD